MVDLANEHSIVCVLPINRKAALRLDALNDKKDGKSKHERTCWVRLLRSLLVSQEDLAKAQKRLAFRV